MKTSVQQDSLGKKMIIFEVSNYKAAFQWKFLTGIENNSLIYCIFLGPLTLAKIKKKTSK